MPRDAHTHAGRAWHWEEDIEQKTHRFPEHAEFKCVSGSKGKCMCDSEGMALANISKLLVGVLGGQK